MDWQVHASGQTIFDADAMNAYLPEFSDVPTVFSSPLYDDQILRALQLFNERAEEEIRPNRSEEFKRVAAGIACDDIVIDPELLALDVVVDVQDIPSSSTETSSVELKQPGRPSRPRPRPGFKEFKFYETPPMWFMLPFCRSYLIFNTRSASRAHDSDYEEIAPSLTRDELYLDRGKETKSDSTGKRIKACKQCRKIRRPCIYNGVPNDERPIQCVYV